MEIEIKKLNEGYIITKDEEITIGVSNEDILEKQIRKILMEKVDVINLMYLQGYQRMNITIHVEALDKKEV